MRRAIPVVFALTTLGCERKATDGGSGASPSASAPSATSDEARLLSLQEEKAIALEKAEQTCKGLGEVLADFDRSHAVETDAIMQRLRAKKAAGQTPPPMTTDETARFQRSKKIIVDTYKRCVEDPDFIAATGSH